MMKTLYRIFEGTECIYEDQFYPNSFEQLLEEILCHFIENSIRDVQLAVFNSKLKIHARYEWKDWTYEAQLSLKFEECNDV